MLITKIRDLALSCPQIEDISDEDISDLGHFVSMFLQWLEMKEGQEFLSWARASLYRIQFNTERGVNYASDADSIRIESAKGCYIDDLAGSVQEV